MANLIYLSLNGQRQGAISEGCSSIDSICNKSQLSHINKIMVLGLTHSITRDHNVNHHAISIIKPVDKSSPLLGKAISENEVLNCEFDFYRTSRVGMNECYYKLKLSNARIAAIHLQVPHAIVDNEGQPEESIDFIYETISWEHCIAGTSGYSQWEDRVN